MARTTTPLKTKAPIAKIAEEAPARAKPRQLLGSAGADESVSVEDDNQLVLALARGLDVLDAFRRSDTWLGNAELADRTGLAKATISRLTYTLARQGYLNFDPRRREYRLGVRAAVLGAIAAATNNVRTVARGLMNEMAQGNLFNLGLGTRDGLQMVYVDVCEGDALISLRLFAGSRIPMAVTAMGRAYLAGLPEAEREQMLEELRPRYDDDWARVRSGVAQAMREVAENGYCASIGEWQKDINGIAVPIRSAPGQPTYAINLGGPAYALSESTLRDTLGPQLRELARKVENLVGLREPD